MSNKAIAVYAEALKRSEEEEKERRQEPTPEVTRKSTPSRDHSREKSRDNPREKTREFPTRNEIQEFSFRLRDEFKVKVQAEVPHQWQNELEEVARTLNVKRLELYRFILGEFLGKVKRKKPA